MKYFITGSFITILILIGLFAYRQNIFSTTDLPLDDEQMGLDDQITIHFSHVVAENTPKGMAAEKFAQLVKEKSDGRVVVRVYPNGMLYNDKTELDALIDNKIQMIAPTNSKITNKLPNWQVLDLPFLIEDQEQLQAILNGPLSEQLLDELDSLQIKGLTFWSNGFKQIAASDELITEVDQFKDKRVRMMPSNILKKQFEFLGAKPIATSFNEVYNDLQKEEIDAQENTISNIYSKKFYTMERNITLSNHGILCYSVMMNESFWNSLDEDIQEIIIDSLNEMQQWQFEQAAYLNELDLQNLSKDPNVTISELDEQNKNRWKEKVQPIYDFYKSKVNEKYLDQLLNEINNVPK